MRFKDVKNLSKDINRIDLDKATNAALLARQTEISEFNRDQLRIGMKADGTFLPPYSPVSVRMGKRPGAIKLYDTGAFYEGINPSFTKSAFEIQDSDGKTDMLQDRYGDNILGLSDYSVGELAQDSLGQIQFELRKQLGI